MCTTSVLAAEHRRHRKWTLYGWSDPSAVHRHRWSCRERVRPSDLHLIDAQSPGRIEPMIELDHATWGGAFRPQDPLSPHAVAAMVQGVNDNAPSPAAS